MCGITGFISGKFKRSHLEGMTRCLGHRGPDADGIFFDEEKKVGLGHRRLSILDLSEAANQPFYSKDGRYVMVYNGEVYNFKEVAAHYKIQTRTTSDSEVIIESFALHGIDCVQQFNGMFALAIWDRVDEKLYLIRDRIGIKPLYYYQNDGDLAFASELKSLFGLPIAKDINQDALTDFLYLGYISGDATIYNACKKIKPGHYGVWHKGQLTVSSYWSPLAKLTPQTLHDEKEAKKRLDELVRTSVSYCMISDVPVGIFLSGGIDSSLVAAAAQAVSNTPVKTFSIGFKEKKYNEAHFADEVARHIKSDHHEFIVNMTDALQLVNKLTDIFDEPYADSSAIPTMMVSALARKHVTVALSGDGGDELFMGYGFYYWAKRLNNPMLKAFRKPLAYVLDKLGDNRLKRGSKLFTYPADRFKSHIFSQEQYFFTEAEIKKLLLKPGHLIIEEDMSNPTRKLTDTEQQSFFDLINYLPEELLVKSDRSSMVHSLEVRVPLLDHRLVEFALNLSPELKMKDKTGKYLLKQVLYDYVPASMFDRPKWGFAIPLATWLKNELSYLLDTYLAPQVVEECKLVNPVIVAELKKEFLNGRSYLYNRLWALIILHKWYKEKHS
jgi:asparagine synthase (glutamine-hydrolysing)